MFSETIISPTTANRITSSPGAAKLVGELLGRGFNAAAFVMDEDLLTAAEAKGFRNDLDRALADLIRQLPSTVLAAVFPPPPEPVLLATSIPDSTGSSGDNSGGGSMREGISMAPPRRKRRDDEPRMRL